MIFVGIDVGVTGALASIEMRSAVGVTLFNVIDMPTTEARKSNGGTRRRVAAGGVTNFLLALKSTGLPLHAWVEQVSARPREGVTSAYTFGHSCGVVEGVIGALGIAYTLVPPQRWMKQMRVPKEGSIERCLQLLPACHELLSRKKDHGRADALLLALYGQQDGPL